MKFRQLFTLPKWLKIFLGVLSVVAVLLIVATLLLNQSVKGEIYSANLILKSQKLLESSNQIAYNFWIDFPKFKPLLRSQTISRVEIERYAWNERIDKNEIKNLQHRGRKIWFESTQDFSKFAESSADSAENMADSAENALDSTEKIAESNRDSSPLAQNDKKGGLPRAINRARNDNLSKFAESTPNSIASIEYKITFKPFLKAIAKYYALILVLVFVPFALWKFFTHLWRALPPKNSADSTENVLDSAPTALDSATKFAESNRDSSHPPLPQNDKLSKFAESSLNLTKKDYAFLAFAFALCSAICAFTFWLGFPGFHIIGDTYNSIALGKNNAHPVFIAYILQGLYFIFGKHLFYLFLFNIVPFYAGIFFLIAGFYLRFKNPFAILLLFPTFIGNIYFQNFIQYHSFALPMMLFCMYSLLLFLILARFKRAKILWILLFVLAFFAILWRHNAIFSVFPAFFIICYLFLQNRGLDSAKFGKIYAKLMILSAILCLFIVIFVPKFLQTSQSHPANHPFLHQIAGACVPADDESCFKDEWYYPHKSWSDVKDLYAKYPLNADPFNVSWGYDSERPFKHEKLNGLQRAWVKAIFKYPLNFFAHEMRFIKAMWWQSPAWIFDAKALQGKASHPWHISVVSDFAESERSVSFSPAQEKIYTFFYERKILLNHIWGVLISLGILIISSAMIWKKRREIFVDSATRTQGAESSLDSAKSAKNVADSAKNILDSATHAQNYALLVFCFAVSFAGFFSAVFIALFTPVAETRYMSPILPMAIIALVGFVAFILNDLSRKK